MVTAVADGFEEDFQKKSNKYLNSGNMLRNADFLFFVYDWPPSGDMPYVLFFKEIVAEEVRRQQHKWQVIIKNVGKIGS